MVLVLSRMGERRGEREVVTTKGRKNRGGYQGGSRGGGKKKYPRERNCYGERETASDSESMNS